jgi:hypothetical protein
VAERVGRGSDDEYCSLYPLDGHHYVSHSVTAGLVRWVERCSLCGHISSKALRAQLPASDVLAGTEALLVKHQRLDPGGCLCGWGPLGASFPGHQVAVLASAGLLAAAAPDAEG